VHRGGRREYGIDDSEPPPVGISGWSPHPVSRRPPMPFRFLSQPANTRLPDFCPRPLKEFAQGRTFSRGARRGPRRPKASMGTFCRYSHQMAGIGSTRPPSALNFPLHSSAEGARPLTSPPYLRAASPPLGSVSHTPFLATSSPIPHDRHNPPNTRLRRVHFWGPVTCTYLLRGAMGPMAGPFIRIRGTCVESGR
jgi:hypothetical protein